MMPRPSVLPKARFRKVSREIPDAVARTLFRLVLDREEIVPPRLPAFVDGTWGRESLRSFWGDVSVSGPSLSFQLNPKHGARRSSLNKLWEMRNEPLRLTLADGVIVDAKFAHVFSGTMERADVEADVWVAAPPGAVPRLWVGPIIGAIYGFGNLSVGEKDGRIDGRHLRVEANYCWHVVRGKDDKSWVILDTLGAPFDLDRVRNDFLALQLAMGVPLRLDTLVGLDEPGKAIAARGLRFGGRHARDRDGRWMNDGPVPSDHIPLFAKSMALALNKTGVLRTAVSAYLDTVVEPTIDGSYLKLHVALEAVCGAIPRDGKDQVIVKDSKAWTRWVRGLEKEIRRHALAPEWEEALVGKLHGAKMLPSSSTVTDAIARLKPPLVLCKTSLAELKKRNIPAHYYVMNKTGDYVVDRDVGRIELLKTVLVAISARLAGYAGPICGWLRPPGELWRPPPSWWPIKSKAKQPTAYYCERTVEIRTPKATVPPAPGRQPAHKGPHIVVPTHSSAVARTSGTVPGATGRAPREMAGTSGPTSSQSVATASLRRRSRGGSRSSTR
jgi:hypothetical protein